ncbi:ATP-binding cassette domain-containing protein [Pusillimonas sp. TS35]|uniref:ABC transporter ATP-binding protein/permease n=1 Tax=Paracandidimonas lactea TaxID=2895524 RepID=UPI001369CC3C|nr:ABC transporter ATP-binding protein/permease [Paracandidimonas lactea]MYN12285.1 ATP-binding cassette domain-containing protein [Pusillimonas sp. TS35]
MNLYPLLIESGIWLLKAYLLTMFAAATTVFALARYTVWGRQFWVLTASYFSPRRNWRPLAALGLLLLLTLAAVRLQVLFSNWYNSMYSALQQLDAKAFWLAMGLFGMLALAHVVRSLLDFYMQQAFTIHWRVWLNERLLDRWLQGQAYYRTQYLDTPADNPDQRIQQDIASFVQGSLTLSFGVINALVSTIAFTLILWNLSGPLTLGSVDIPRGMVFLVFGYVLLATACAVRIGRPLIGLNFLNERFNADYRYALMRLREYAESVAFYGGEKVERMLLNNRFSRVIENAWSIVYRSLKFLGFNFSVSQAAVVFPFIIQAPRFFSKQISLGDLMQTAQAFGQLQDNLSFFRNAYDQFATYRATLNRLSGFSGAVDNAAQLPSPALQNQPGALALHSVTVTTPDGHLLLGNASLDLASTGPLLIRGPSGAGKTTLLRAIAGLWPHATGRIIRPMHSTLFLAQKPYLPLGTLRNALYYPHPVPGSRPQENTPAADDAVVATAAKAITPTPPLPLPDSKDTDAEIGAVLAAVQLSHLEPRLDEDADWSRILSLGEQQRLAFGRLLLTRPELALLDEATSAMDEGLEDAMYRLIKTHLSDTLLVSVGHRGTLVRHHQTLFTLAGDGSGAWTLSSATPAAPGTTADLATALKTA